MKLTLTTKKADHSLDIGVPNKVKKMGSALKSAFTRAKKVKKVKPEELLIRTLQSFGSKLDNLASKIEGDDKPTKPANNQQ